MKLRAKQHKLLTTVCIQSVFFFIVNVTEREFLFLILVGETFFFFCLMTRVATFATAIFFFFFYHDLEKIERSLLKEGETASLETTKTGDCTKQRVKISISAVRLGALTVAFFTLSE